MCTAVHVILSILVLFSLLCFLFLFIVLYEAGSDAKQCIKNKKEREGDKKRYLHELPLTEVVNSGTIRRAGCVSLTLGSLFSVMANFFVFAPKALPPKAGIMETIYVYGHNM